MEPNDGLLKKLDQSEKLQGHLGRLASERHERIIDLETKMAAASGHARYAETLQQQLQAAREEIERLKKDPLCQALTDPDCCCHSCLKDAAIEESLKLEQRLRAADQRCLDFERDIAALEFNLRTELKAVQGNYQTLLDDAVLMREQLQAAQAKIQVVHDEALQFAERTGETIGNLEQRVRELDLLQESRRIAYDNCLADLEKALKKP